MNRPMLYRIVGAPFARSYLPGPSLTMRTVPSSAWVRPWQKEQALTKRFYSGGSLNAAYYRGGTSRAVMFQSKDLPVDRNAWPEIFRKAIGSPDPNGRQLDGMGGGISSLSKVCVIGPSERDDADVDYTFAAIGVKNSDVDFTSNCGNMSSAIGPYAVDSGLIEPGKDAVSATVRIHNTNTGKIIHSSFPLDQKRQLAVDGDFQIDGVSGKAAKIQLEFLNPTGSKTGKFLPTSRATDLLAEVPATCIDVGNPCVFVSAKDLGVAGGILPDDIAANQALVDRLDKIRRLASVAMGISRDAESTPGSIPKIAMVSPSHEHALLSGERTKSKDADLVVRSMSVGQPHRAVPITVAMALASAATLHGSVVKECVTAERVDADGVTLSHPGGRLLVSTRNDENGVVKSAIVFRTARKIMDGSVYI